VLKISILPLKFSQMGGFSSICLYFRPKFFDRKTLFPHTNFFAGKVKDDNSRDTTGTLRIGPTLCASETAGLSRRDETRANCLVASLSFHHSVSTELRRARSSSSSKPVSRSVEAASVMNCTQSR